MHACGFFDFFSCSSSWTDRRICYCRVVLDHPSTGLKACRLDSNASWFGRDAKPCSSQADFAPSMQKRKRLGWWKCLECHLCLTVSQETCRCHEKSQACSSPFESWSWVTDLFQDWLAKFTNARDWKLRNLQALCIDLSLTICLADTIQTSRSSWNPS